MLKEMKIDNQFTVSFISIGIQVRRYTYIGKVNAFTLRLKQETNSNTWLVIHSYMSLILTTKNVFFFFLASVTEIPMVRMQI